MTAAIDWMEETFLSPSDMDDDIEDAIIDIDEGLDDLLLFEPSEDLDEPEISEDDKKNINVSFAQRFAGLTIDPERKYQLSLFSFRINHINLVFDCIICIHTLCSTIVDSFIFHEQEPCDMRLKYWYVFDSSLPCCQCNVIWFCFDFVFSATDSSKVAVKTLGLSQESYYQYGYIAIVNDDSFMSEVDLAGQLCWAWMSLMIAVTITFTGCNMRMFHVRGDTN